MAVAESRWYNIGDRNMAGRNEENLRHLFERFFAEEDAERCAEDVRKAEQMLQQWPAPEPDDELMVDIKAAVAARLQQRKEGAFRRAVYKVAAVAAMVFIVAVINVKVFDRGESKPGEIVTASLWPAGIWDSEDVSVDDAILSALNAQIEQIESEVLALQLGENGGNGDRAVAELEMEFLDIVSDFWKG